MSEKELNIIIGKNISKYMDRKGLTQMDVAEYMGCSQTTISNWCKGLKLPRMDKIDKLCELFNVRRSELMEDKELSKEQILQRAFNERPEMRMLFSVAEDATAEEILQAIKIIEALKK